MWGKRRHVPVQDNRTNNAIFEANSKHQASRRLRSLPIGGEVATGCSECACQIHQKKIMQEWPPDGTYNFMIVEAYNFKERNQTGDDVKLQPQRNCGFLSSLA